MLIFFIGSFRPLKVVFQQLLLLELGQLLPLLLYGFAVVEGEKWLDLGIFLLELLLLAFLLHINKIIVGFHEQVFGLHFLLVAEAHIVEDLSLQVLKLFPIAFNAPLLLGELLVLPLVDLP